MSPEKILSIIKEKDIFTVKLENTRLMNIVYEMCNKGDIHLKDVYKDYFYYGLDDGRNWTLKDGYETPTL